MSIRAVGHRHVEHEQMTVGSEPRMEGRAEQSGFPVFMNPFGDIQENRSIWRREIGDRNDPSCLFDHEQTVRFEPRRDDGYRFVKAQIRKGIHNGVRSSRRKLREIEMSVNGS